MNAEIEHLANGGAARLAGEYAMGKIPIIGDLYSIASGMPTITTDYMGRALNVSRGDQVTTKTTIYLDNGSSTATYEYCVRKSIGQISFWDIYAEVTFD